MKCDELTLYHSKSLNLPIYVASEVDAAIAELKSEIRRKEAVEQRWFEQCMEARSEAIRLKRALYKACANWAHSAVAFFSSYATKEKWRKMECLCLKKAEGYKRFMKKWKEAK